MKRIRTILIVVLLLGLIGGLAYFLGVRSGRISKEPVINSTIIEEQLESVKELTTVKYKYTNVGSFENQSEFYGIKIPLTTKKFIISYDGVINAGVDLGAAEIKVVDKNINIKLPKAEILSHEIEEDSIKIFDEKNSIFNPLQIDDYSSFREDQMKKTEDKVIKEGFLDEAMSNTKFAIEDLLKINPTIAEEYTINVK